ncbi:glycosyltransferase family 2 protein [Corynebacterium glutamicum]|uniref:glycosyltransferase family 2 protein n=1 Tax=Corynebacterium glutamicum TaxID=1718 RepID=UPI003C7D52D9
MNENKNPLVSIVIPVFNIEDLISKCIDSVIAQTYSNLEIILVNDGSTDQSSKICNEYAEIDGRIVLIDKENGGLSDARNCGIEKASGTLLTCIDGDDFISPTYVESLVSPFQESNVDLSVIGFKKVLPDFEYGTDSPFVSDARVELLTRNDALKKLFLQQGITTSAWGKMYKRESFTADIEYPVGKTYEDLPVTYRLFAKANLVAVILETGYFYVQHSKSITSTTRFNQRVHTIGFVEEAVDFVKANAPELTVVAEARAFMESVFIVSQVPSVKLLKHLDPLVLENAVRHRRAIFKTGSGLRQRAFAVMSFGGKYPLWYLARLVSFLGTLKTKYAA